MKFGKAHASAPTEVRARLGEGTEITGEVNFSDVFRVDSKLSGKVISEDGCLVVSEGGTVQATVEVGFVEVFGTLEGTVTAKQRVQIHPGGRVIGDIFTPVLNIEFGAVFDGQCHMIEDKRAEPDKAAGSMNLFTKNNPAVPLAG
jgi:cytoskeletal protein CcmA (bactofilin family)